MPTVLCFGEILWDVLPQGRFPGGAPLNLACQLRGLGVRPLLISAVGRDPEGDELMRCLSEARLELAGIVRDAGRPTGSVRATLSPHGDAQYTIPPDTAWDRVVLSEWAIRTASGARAIVFGSLAQRSEHNRKTLEQLLSLLPAAAERVLDVNLRPPYDDLVRVRELAARATVLKLNAEEAARLCADDKPQAGREEAQARQLAAAYRAGAVCVTAGDRGAGLFDGTGWYWEPARSIRVRDTVGAGDAFLAGLLAGRLEGLPAPMALAQACRLGELAASRSGGASSIHVKGAP